MGNSLPQNYRFNSEDKAVVFEVERLIRRLIFSGRLRPAEIVSVAKVLHVLVNLPRVNENVSVSVELRAKQDGQGRFKCICFSVSNELHLECETEDGLMTLEWDAYPGRRTERGDYWETEWSDHFYRSNDPLALNLEQCVITVEDEENPLLWDRADPDQEEQTFPDTTPGGISNE